jgi:predicted nucleic acid-binding protein
MIVVADTSPLNYLVLIEEADLLPKLFGRVVIPQAVFNELHATGASEIVRDWAQNLPVWVEVRQTHLTSNASLDILDAGEKEAILLAQELAADLLLVDDRQARQAAVSLGVAITGTIGILDKAAQTGLIDLRTVIGKLRKTNFFIAENLIQRLMENER